MKRRRALQHFHQQRANLHTLSFYVWNGRRGEAPSKHRVNYLLVFCQKSNNSIDIVFSMKISIIQNFPLLDSHKRWRSLSHSDWRVSSNSLDLKKDPTGKEAEEEVWKVPHISITCLEELIPKASQPEWRKGEKMSPLHSHVVRVLQGQDKRWLREKQFFFFKILVDKSIITTES